MMERILARIGAFGCFSKFSPIVKPVKLIYFMLAKSCEILKFCATFLPDNGDSGQDYQREAEDGDQDGGQHCGGGG